MTNLPAETAEKAPPVSVRPRVFWHSRRRYGCARSLCTPANLSYPLTFFSNISILMIKNRTGKYIQQEGRPSVRVLFCEGCPYLLRILTMRANRCNHYAYYCKKIDCRLSEISQKISVHSNSPATSEHARCHKYDALHIKRKPRRGQSGKSNANDKN
jgi:hypothetical protein